jgi:probable phosphoglycerate mutase
LVRHAQPLSDGVKRFVGQCDPPLSETGRTQAAWWRDRLRHVEFTRIVSSDLKRARQTARIMAGKRAPQLELAPGLREIYLGAWENQPLSRIRDRFPEQWHARGSDLAGYRPPGGESFGDVQQRVMPLIDDIMATAGSDVLAVAHAGVNRVLLCTLLGMPLQRLFDLEQHPAGMNLIDFSSARPRVKAVNLAPGILVRIGWADAPPA